MMLLCLCRVEYSGLIVVFGMLKVCVMFFFFIISMVVLMVFINVMVIFFC